MRALLLLAGLVCLGGCVSSTTRFESEFFGQPPEIWERDGAYHVRLFEPALDPTGYSIAEAEIHGSEVHVWLWPRHSSGSNPNRLLPLGIPVAAAPPTFLWKDPDGTLHPMRVRRG
jgi:hypothetical protein